jgi:hypothetical protein
MRSGAFHAMQGTRDPARGQSYRFAEDCLSKDTLEDGSLQGDSILRLFQQTLVFAFSDSLFDSLRIPEATPPGSPGSFLFPAKLNPFLSFGSGSV